MVVYIVCYIGDRQIFGVFSSSERARRYVNRRAAPSCYEIVEMRVDA